GNGQSNKLEQVVLNNYDPKNGKLIHSTQLTSLYGANPPFPGNYNTTWDNPTWFLNSYPTTPAGDTAVQAGESSETAVITPFSSNKGCVSWGAMVLSTTVQDSDLDGLPDTWKTSQGYCDAGANRGLNTQGTCPLGVNDPSWVALPGAKTGQQDLFLQVDYMCLANPDGSPNCNPANGGLSYGPTAQVLTNLTAAFAANGHGINVHIDPN